MKRTIAIIAIALAPATSGAQQDFDHKIRQIGEAVAIEQIHPGYPGGQVRRGQEGWVRVSFLVTTEGRAVDPVVLDSSGGGGFEKEARKAIAAWRFEARETELPSNIVDFRTEIRGGRDAATSNFLRRTRRIVTHLRHEELDEARTQVDAAYKLGGWNLYESTMLWLMLGRVEGAEDNPAGKLEMYNRALAIGNKKAIPADDRAELLEKIFLLQSHFQQYAAAARTHRLLSETQGSEKPVERTTDRIAEIRRILDEETVLTARATIFNPCDCESGEPLWHYVPTRRTFSFANPNGNVERFEARCERQRVTDRVQPGRTWTLEPHWGSCRVIVFGEDGATFEFLEHQSESDALGPETVARKNVLDRGNRSR